MVAIYCSRGVCGEADVGNQKLLAPVVVVSGAFATAIEMPILAVKHAGIRHKHAVNKKCSPGLAVNKKVGIKKKLPSDFFFARPFLIK